MWQWHTRTWVLDGAIHSTVKIGIGWYLVYFALLAIVAVVVAWKAV